MEANLELGMIGNCAWGGLLDAQARLVWACMPRFDSDPLFPALLDEAPDHDGSFTIDLLDFASSEQSYDGHTAILVTVLRDRAGNAVEIRDFAPRFTNHGRIYRPTTLIRRLRPLHGEPRIRIVLRPRCGYGAQRPSLTRGSNHLRIVAPEITLRLTTNAPISYVTGAVPFLLDRPIDLILGPDESLLADVAATAREFDERTRDYWSEWSRTLSIPFEWQDAVIRAAISLKLCNYEETGAIVAALTTSIPEAPHSGRNWDYRFCWLRDAYFVIHALNRLGATKTMEGFLSYIQNLAAARRPAAGLRHRARGEPRRAHRHAAQGLPRHGPRAGRATRPTSSRSTTSTAASCSRRRTRSSTAASSTAAACACSGCSSASAGMPRASGTSPTRGSGSCARARTSTRSRRRCAGRRAIGSRRSPACSASARAARAGAARRIASAPGSSRAAGARAATASSRASRATSSTPRCCCCRRSASSPPTIRASSSTVAAIEKELRRGPYLLRYAAPDDFGAPSTAFNICTFWYIDALIALGRRGEARELFENMLARRNRLGLLSEDLDPETGELWGNLPQTYSMVGLITTATRLSKGWEDAF